LLIVHSYRVPKIIAPKLLCEAMCELLCECANQETDLFEILEVERGTPNRGKAGFRNFAVKNREIKGLRGKCMVSWGVAKGRGPDGRAVQNR